MLITKTYNFIYKTTNLITGKYYIGMHSTDDLNDGYLGSGKRLGRSIKKYGKNNHKLEIVEFVDGRANLMAREKEIVTLNEIAKTDCMNLAVGGLGGTVVYDEDAKRRHLEGINKGGESFVKRLTEDEEFSKKHSEVSSERLRKTWKEGKIKVDGSQWLGKNHSAETIKKMSDAKKGKGCIENNSQYGTCWITDGMANKKIMKSMPLPNGWVFGRVQKKI